MSRVKIDNKIVISYNFEARDKYWSLLSKFIISKYGKQTFIESKDVEAILLDSFNFLASSFKQITFSEDKFRFYQYVFWLHEQSIEIYFKTLDGFVLTDISDSEFAIYRRILKLILEQGCEIDLTWGDKATSQEVLRMDEVVQELLYIGTWLYGFADFYAQQKMIEDCHFIEFDDNEYLVIDWQYHYGKMYNSLLPEVITDYNKAIVDEESIKDLRSKIEECFEVSYDFAGGVIFEVLKQLSPESPNLQTLEPYVLPINLSNAFKIDIERAKIFYSGLTISKLNKLTLEDAILKPHSTKRYMYRPIIVFKIDGIERALIGKEKFAESIYVLSTNAINWNIILDEWLDIKCIKKYIEFKSHKNDKLLENKIEEIIKESGYYYCRNLKSLKQLNKKPNINIDNYLAGEIDFIIINNETKTVLVSDSKYNRARYEAVGFRMDYSNFINIYEPKMHKKVNWVRKNILIVQDHFKIIYKNENISISDYRVEGLFFINTPTFYMFNGAFKAISVNKISDYLKGDFDYPDIIFETDDDIAFYQHPYFSKPQNIEIDS